MSEQQDGNWRTSRRTYLKGAAALGLSASLAGCTDLGTWESTVVGFSPETATASGYVSADHRDVVKEQETGSYRFGYKVVSHAVGYEKDPASLGFDSPDTEGGAGFGTFTTPIPSVGPNSLRSFNPFVGASIPDLIGGGSTAKSLLKGFGVEVGANVNWVEGPTNNAKKIDELEILDSPFLNGVETSNEEYIQSHGVLRSGGKLRAVLLHIARVEVGDSDEVLFAGRSLHQVVDEASALSGFRDEYDPSEYVDFSLRTGEIEEIDPETDLQGLS